MDAREPNSMDRRDFYKLSLAAFSGMVAVSAAADATEAADEAPAGTAPPSTQGQPGAARKMKPKDGSNPLLHEPHVCRGLNTCKGKGKDGQNACAGTGSCHTAPQNACGGHNECRGLGACDRPPQAGYPGENTCKGQGGCEVPMLPNKPEMWKKARARFEWLMADMGKKVGKPR